MVKVLKKIIIFCIVLTQICNKSNATLTNVADGASFVTKAEFDSALSSFNSKLTKFEAETNSKIDSQVTSYLERNGIWNGDVVEAFEGKKLYITQTAADRVYCCDNSRNYRNQNKIWRKWDFVPRKTGLFVMNYEMVCDATNCDTKMLQITYTSTNGAGRDAVFYLFVDLYNDIYDRVYFKTYTNTVGCVNVNDWIRVNFRGYTGNICTFVKAGETYSFRAGDYWDYQGAVTIEFNTRIPYPWYFDISYARIF